MTHQQCCPDVDTVVDLRALTFKRKEDDGRMAVYRGYLHDKGAPGEPLYAVTVTVASPNEDEEAKAELEAFLSEMLVGFVLTAPVPDEYPCDDQESEPFNIDNQLQIEFALVRSTIENTVGVTAVVHTTVEGRAYAGEDFTGAGTGTLPELTQFVRRRVQTVSTRDLRGSVLQGKDHRYTAVGGLKRRATVTARLGRGSIRPARRRPIRRIRAGGPSRSVRARTLIVHAASRILVVDVIGRFLAQ
jgi:hypothetical protein